MNAASSYNWKYIQTIARNVIMHSRCCTRNPGDLIGITFHVKTIICIDLGLTRLVEKCMILKGVQYMSIDIENKDAMKYHHAGSLWKPVGQRCHDLLFAKKLSSL